MAVVLVQAALEREQAETRSLRAAVEAMHHGQQQQVTITLPEITVSFR
jgi:hypothetical protein